MSDLTGTKQGRCQEISEWGKNSLNSMQIIVGN